MRGASSAATALLGALVSTILPGCGGGSGGSSGGAPPPVMATIGGTVSGLLGSGLLLMNNGAGSLAISSDGTFTFPSAQVAGSPYDVTVAAQPVGPVQICSVNAGSGTASASVQSVIVNCVLPTPKFAYVVSLSASIFAYAIDPASGALTPVSGSPFAARSAGLHGIAIEPGANYAYACGLDATGTSGQIFALRINHATGALTPLAATPAITGGNFTACQVNAAGNALYATDAAFGLFAYSLNALSGALSPASGSALAKGSYFTALAADPAAPFVYTVDAGGGVLGAPDAIYGYSTNAATGAATPLAGAGVSQTGSTSSITVDPAGRYAYTVNGVTNTATTYAIGAAGQLSAVGNSIAVGTQPGAIAVNPNGNIAFVADYPAGKLAAFSINRASGAFTAVAGSPYAIAASSTTTAPGPVDVTLDPSGIFAYVLCGAMASQSTTPQTGQIAIYSLNGASGALTALLPPVSVGSAFPTAMAIAGF